jgi:hypothetical protein
MIEALLATAILLFAITATLTLYDEAWKHFKRGENAIEQQQAVRAGFEKLNLDLQMAGFNYNLDGDDSRPDEQIEAAFDTAVVIRADFDHANPSLVTMPEASLAGGAFDTVSVGNDEIVAYILAKPDGSSSGMLTFDADVKDAPRDGNVETVGISGVALVHDDPPYNLYRISLNNDTGTWGSDGFAVRTLVAENIRSLTFRYFDGSGNLLNSTFDLATASDDIGGGEAASQLLRRSSIRRIEVDLVGLTRDPDLGWRDPRDSDPATRAHRKFELRGDVTLRNGGMVGLQDLPPS